MNTVRYSFIAILFLALSSALAMAQMPAPNYNGDFWSRPGLTGDWGGLRNQLAEKGVTFEADFGSILQSVVDGRDTTTRWSGWNQVILKLDFSCCAARPRITIP